MSLTKCNQIKRELLATNRIIIEIRAEINVVN